MQACSELRQRTALLNVGELAHGVAVSLAASTTTLATPLAVVLSLQSAPIDIRLVLCQVDQGAETVTPCDSHSLHLFYLAISLSAL